MLRCTLRTMLDMGGFILASGQIDFARLDQAVDLSLLSFIKIQLV